jgi:hypothetical protein
MNCMVIYLLVFLIPSDLFRKMNDVVALFSACLFSRSCC